MLFLQWIILNIELGVWGRNKPDGFWTHEYPTEVIVNRTEVLNIVIHSFVTPPGIMAVPYSHPQKENSFDIPRIGWWLQRWDYENKAPLPNIPLECQF